MLTRWGDFDRTSDLFTEMRRRMEEIFEDFGTGLNRGVALGVWPRVNLWDRGESLMVTAEVPGLSDKDLTLTVNQDVLTIEGERRVDVPKNYAVHRQERVPVRFARSFALPCRIDAERAQAIVKDGVLTVTLPKAPEARPRQISVRSQ
jgi:HSP20 family protein